MNRLSPTLILAASFLLLACGRSSILAESESSQPDNDAGSIGETGGSEAGEDAPDDVEKPEAGLVGCELEIVATGWLGEEGTDLRHVTALDATATPAGFVVAFQEVGGSFGRIHRVAIDDKGVVHGRERDPDVSCLYDAHGVGAAWNEVEEIGLIAAVCGESLTLTNVDERGGTLQLVSGEVPGAFSLAQSDAISAADGPDAFFLASTGSGEAALFTAFGTMLTAGITLMPGSEGATSAHVAWADDITAMVANGNGGAAPYSLTYGNVHLPDLTTVELADAQSAAVESWGERIFAAVSRSPGVAWWEVNTAGGSVDRGEISMPEAEGLEVVRLRDHVFVIGSTDGELTVVRLDEGPGGRVEGARVRLDASMDLPDIVWAENGLLAAAATGNGLLVAWGGTDQVLDKDPYGRGGYAVLHCAP